MSPDPWIGSPLRLAPSVDEQRAWARFYRLSHEPAIAALVLVELDADPQMKRQHLALYLACRESLSKHQARRLRQQQFGRGVRLVLRFVLVEPVLGIAQLLRDAGELLHACLPEEPPARRVLRRAPRAVASPTRPVERPAAARAA
jgi:hypothetical protein